MRIIIGLLALVFSLQLSAQSNAQLLSHYEAYYSQMKSQGDVQGVINALTHLNILAPNQSRKDTLALLYMNEGRHIQALNTIGIEKNTNDSDVAVEVKAVSLQALNQTKLAVGQFEEMFKRGPNVLIAYELADMKTQLNDLEGAKKHIEYGITNATDEVQRTYYESQVPYQVSSKAAFLYLKGLVTFREDPKANIDAAIAVLDEALAVAPEFNLAKISKDALLAQKKTPVKND
ncbi:MAG: hypothetical protein HKN00_01425 [Flavobacteriaceae bacterium]|nr:hypothetical protein [Bacteroidia bacterium]NNF73816.1 hypothetical protein [Flavobacteriaceae bacterium]NNK71987.1 hypothetical protein [Flavobacteriaceae bacterium]